MPSEKDPAKKLLYPRWYTPVKWWLPLSLAFLSGFYVWLALLGMVGVPAVLGPLAWAPVLFSQLDKVPALFVLMTATSMVACTVGVFSSFFVRGLLLHVAEEKAEVGATMYECLEKERQLNYAEHQETFEQSMSHIQDNYDNMSENVAKLCMLLSKKNKPQNKKTSDKTKKINETATLSLSNSNESLTSSNEAMRASDLASPRSRRHRR